MNPEIHDCLQRLEQATSRDEPVRGKLDEETAQLRESWLALGQLLAEADAAPLSCVSWPACVAPPVPRRRVRLGGMLACAGALLAAACVAWYYASGQPALWGGDELETASDHLPANETRLVAQNQLSRDVHIARDASTHSSWELEWDDAMDDPVAMARDEIWRLQGAAPQRDRNWVHLSEMLYGMSEDLASESL